METFVREDDNGNTLTIDFGGVYAEISVDSADGPFRAFPEDLRKITRELYEAAGLPSPVILDRPAIATPAIGDSARCGDLSLRMYDGGISMGLPGVTAAAISPDALRRRAAFMAAYADAVESEPDPAEVAALAQAIAGDCSAGIESAKPTARKILLAGYAKAAGGAS